MPHDHVQASVSEPPSEPPASPAPDSSAADEMRSIMAAFDAFQTKATDLTDTYGRLEAEAARLSEEVTRKNQELAEKQVLIEAMQAFGESASSLEETYSRLESQVEHLNNSLRAIVDSLNHGVIAVDLEGRITLFNRAATELTRRTEEEVIGRVYADVFPNHPTILLETLRGAQAHVQEFEDYFGANGGRKRHMEVTTALVLNDQGDVRGAVEVLRDLTERREMQEQLERSKVHAALGEVSIAIAHEIRNPLGAIQLYMETLRDGGLEGDERDRMFDHVFNGIKLMNSTISNLLQFTRPVLTAADFQNLSPMLDQALALAEHAIRVEHVEVTRDYPPIGLMCHVDESQFVTALLNVLLNAVQATASKDSRAITVRARRRDPDPMDRPMADGYGGVPWVEVEVADNGCGIHPDMLERVFTPFVTTKDDGIGLGLPIVHKVVEAHGGKVTVDSTEHVGTRIRILLPVYRPREDHEV
ncbi:PAS domain S-box protein [Candidatus Poribacteria bacterium]|jgi:PAS domain S-box-containing protein|nr:PAS domain S-box protein [Candidatus Poribacteria bacterium]MBT5531999.1 PAS domain S-box protein [Candidatus Poribacteria bacterium]MBT5714245.1 PAS domain S-box protein [Candidatus Poribacteria bacterium]MBT7100122.1 PAS domain S-box protein [Candidatus Poribacteria bacterium]MBT7809135.1 PAS domain S-box protein [Candidatus Poribacteria bacterium]